MNGFLLIDKPTGVTSFDVVFRVRKLLKVRRAGHCGTLDPLATGLLIVAVGKATKLTQFLIGREKSYEVEAKLGQTSDTYDRDGNLSEISPTEQITREVVASALAEFRGSIRQRPPLYSAIKHEGKRLYKYARAGREVEVPEREVTIHELELLEFEASQAKISVRCSKGTYIRSLVHDLGEKLGCGAHVTELRRTAIGEISVAEAISPAELAARVEVGDSDSQLIGIAEMLDLPELVVDAKRAGQVPHGIEIRAADIVESAAPVAADQLVALRNGHGNLLAVARTLLGSAQFGQQSEAKAIEYVRVM